jgi:hypothetical protein
VTSPRPCSVTGCLARSQHWDTWCDEHRIRFEHAGAERSTAAGLEAAAWARNEGVEQPHAFSIGDAVELRRAVNDIARGLGLEPLTGRQLFPQKHRRKG